MAPNPGRREALLDKVVDDFVANGAITTSLRPLAKRLGVSTYSLSYHFGDKAGLISAAIEALLVRQQARLSERLASVRGGPKAALEAVWSFAQESLEEDRLLLELWLRDEHAVPSGRERTHDLWRAWICERLVAQGMRCARAEREATLVLAVIWGLELDLMQGGDPQRTTAALELFARETAARWTSQT